MVDNLKNDVRIEGSMNGAILELSNGDGSRVAIVNNGNLNTTDLGVCPKCPQVSLGAIVFNTKIRTAIVECGFQYHASGHLKPNMLLELLLFAWLFWRGRPLQR